jgi:hypothetical protein
MCVVFFLYHHSSAIPLNLPLFLTSFVQARLSPLPNYVTMHDCIAIFSKFDVKTVKKDTVIITGKRTTNGLWEIPLATTSHQANGILRLDKSKAELAMAVLPCYTRQSGTIHSSSSSYPSWTPYHFSKPHHSTHYQASPQVTCYCTWSTRLPLLSTAAPVCNTSTDIEPQLEPRSHQLCATLLTQRDLLKSYLDQTGKFHTPSSRGNHYIFVLYHTDTNSIHTVAIPNRLAGTIRDAWEATHKMLIHQGHPPELHVLDNECSDDLKKAFLKYNVQFELCQHGRTSNTHLQKSFDCQSLQD